jgi:hypothetical protein
MTEETPKQILVIDDDPNYRALLLDLLGKAFAKIQVATLDPLKSGLPDASFDWTRFDVVIIDSNLGRARPAPVSSASTPFGGVQTGRPLRYCLPRKAAKSLPPRPFGKAFTTTSASRG